MSYNISKELFEAVYGRKVDEHTDLRYKGFLSTLVVNDFFFACKEWAYNKGYIIKTDIAGEWELYNFKNGGIFDAQNSSSEQQAVFDACMYILDKDKQ